MHTNIIVFGNHQNLFWKLMLCLCIIVDNAPEFTILLVATNYFLCEMKKKKHPCITLTATGKLFASCGFPFFITQPSESEPKNEHICLYTNINTVLSLT